MILPRFIRLKEAPRYLGMDKNRFNVEVRPFVTEIRIGVQGIAFDRLDLDEFADEYKDRNGRPGRQKGEGTSWRKERRVASPRKVRYGTSTKSSEAIAFEKALEQAISKKPSGTSRTALRK